MNAKQFLKESMALTDRVVEKYLGDLTDADLLIRPVPGANHIAWQLGHLIASENGLISAIAPGSMPPLPAGFKEKYTKETSREEGTAGYLKKDEYLKLMQEQRAGTLAVLEKLTDDDLDKPAPESLPRVFGTVSRVMNLALAAHVMMHAGQWAVVRRKLGKPVAI